MIIWLLVSRSMHACLPSSYHHPLLIQLFLQQSQWLNVIVIPGACGIICYSVKVCPWLTCNDVNSDGHVYLHFGNGIGMDALSQPVSQVKQKKIHQVSTLSSHGKLDSLERYFLLAWHWTTIHIITGFIIVFITLVCQQAAVYTIWSGTTWKPATV